jgi:DnaK suppressor protein
MTLSQTQIQGLKTQLLEQQAKLQDVLRSLKAGDPASDVNRPNDNADIGTEATESNDLVAYESLEHETQIMLDRIQGALERMEQGTYGVTDEGDEIPFERLSIDPTATTIVK